MLVLRRNWHASVIDNNMKANAVQVQPMIVAETLTRLVIFHSYEQLRTQRRTHPCIQA
jgi:hypothetical protein